MPAPDDHAMYRDHSPTIAIGPNSYRDIPNRSGRDNDLQTYFEPLPKLPGDYMTFWAGNQLPGQTMATAPATFSRGYLYREAMGVQRTGAAFGGGWLSAVRSFNLLDRMRAAWASSNG